MDLHRGGSHRENGCWFLSFDLGQCSGLTYNALKLAKKLQFTGQLFLLRQQTLDPTLIDLIRLVMVTMGLLQRTFGETDDFTTALESDLKRTSVDPGQIQNALLNLA